MEPAETTAPTEATEPTEARGPDAEPPRDPVAARKKAIVGLLAAIVIGAAATAIASYAQQHVGAVVRVDGVAVTKAEYDARLADAMRRMGGGQVDFNSAQGKQVLADLKTGLIGQLVERALIREEGVKRGIQVPDADVQAQVNRTASGFKSPAEFDQKLKENGLDRAAYEAQVRDMLGVQRVVEAVTKDVDVSPAEVKAYYDQNKKLYDRPLEVRARHVLVKDEAVAKLVQQKLQGGGDFAALAKEYSEDPGSKGDGGDLGYFGRGRMVKEFEDAAFSTPPGKVSGLVKTKFGYHLIKVEDRRAPHTQGFDEVAREITENLRAERRRSAFTSWLAERKKVATIQYQPGYAPGPGAKHPGE